MKGTKGKILSVTSRLTIILLLSMTLLNMSNHSIFSVTAAKGPRTDDLIIRYYADVEQAYEALKAGEIDIVGCDIARYIDPVPANAVDDYIWIASFGPENLKNNGLPGKYVGTDNPYNGFGVPYWTGNFSLAYPLVSVNQINVTCLPSTPDNYTYTLTEGVDYIVHANENLVELLNPVDVPIINEHWKDGVNNSLNGWPWIKYVASGIESVFVDMNNGTARLGRNCGYAQPPPCEWWFDPDFAWELEGWWALGYFLGSWNWPLGSDWWINYTAASYLTINYNVEGAHPGKDLYIDAINDPNIVLAPVADQGFYQFDLNNNYTIAMYPGVRSPTNYTGFRQALAWLTDKEFIVDEICGGFAERIDQMIAAPYRAWGNATMMYPYYPYEYDPIAAAWALDAEGFLQGTTPNPYYDAAFPGSAEYIRTYPAGHSKAGQDLDPLEVVVRTDDSRTFDVGQLIASNMKKHGIPVHLTEGDFNSIYDKVFGQHDYHLYTGSHRGGRFPPTVLHGLYHSDFAFPYGQNYVTGNGTHPYLDTLLEGCRYPATYDEAITYTKLAAGYMTELAVTVPLWSSRSFWGWSNKLLGVVNMAGVGPVNGYTFMNAYRYDVVNGRPKPTGEPIRLGLCGAPNAVNIMYSSWFYDYQNLDRMDMYGGVDVPPYDLSADQDGFVTERLVGTWDDGGETKTKVTYTFRTDAYFVEPLTGNQLENVNATHAYVSIWYDYQLGDGWFYPDVEDVHHLNIIGSHTIEIYFDSYSYWNAYYATPPFKSFNLLQKATLSAQRAWSGSWTGPAGFLGLSHKVYWVVDISIDAVSLTRGSEWHIERDGPLGHADVWVNTTRTGTLVINYWSAEDAKGFTPGNLPWAEAFEGCGMFYATGFTHGVGGSLTLKRNPYYWMETPVLGEIDFVRKPNGELKVDIFDLNLIATAYGSQGIGVPDSRWLSGADLFPFGGFIDEFDAAVVMAAISSIPEYHNVTLVDVTPLQTQVTSGTLVPISVTVENQGDYTETFDVVVRANETKVATTEVTLSSGEGTTIILTWDTTGFKGSYAISAYAGPVDYERSLWDNILIDDTVTVEPVEYTIVVKAKGQEYDLAVESDTTLTQVIATRNTLRFKATGPEGRIVYINTTIPVELNTTEIKVFVDGTRLTYPPFPIITTNGTHYFVYFEITLSTREISIQHATPDAILENVSSSKTVIGQGYTSTINVTVHNQGNFTKTFNVTVYADQNAILLGDEIIVDIQNVTLTAGTSTIVTFTWNTTSEAKGNYTISATADDSMVYGWVFVTIPGDVDGDRDVDIYDIVQMANIYGVSKPDPLYDPNCDIDDDGDIDIYDIVIAANNYGEGW